MRQPMHREPRRLLLFTNGSTWLVYDMPEFDYAQHLSLEALIDWMPNIHRPVYRTLNPCDARVFATHRMSHFADIRRYNAMVIKKVPEHGYQSEDL